MVARNMVFGLTLEGMNAKPINEVNKKMDDMKDKAKGAGKDVDSLSDKLSKMGKGMDKAGKTMMKGVTLPLVGIGTAAIATVSKFDDSMSQVGAIAGDLTDNEFTDLRDMAKELGSTTAHSASAAADSMATLAAAGYDYNQIQAATPEVLSLASAGMLELDQAAGILTGTLAMFNMDATNENFQRVADVTANAASSANTSVEEIGEAMNMAGGAAASMGMDIEQTNAVLGIFANRNITGGRAGTTFTAMQSDLASAVEGGTIAIGEQSVAVFDSNEEWRDMGSIMADVESATKDMTGEQKSAILMNTFGVQSMKGVTAMLSAGSEGYKELEEAMYDSEGAAAAMAETMEDNIGGAFRSLSSATEGLLIEIGDVLKGPVQEIADFVAKLAGKFGELDQPAKEMIVKIGLVAAAIGPVLLIGSKILAGMSMIGSVVGFILSPLGLLTGVVIGLGAGMVYLWKTNEDFREGVIQTWDTVQEKMGSAVGYIRGLWDEHGEAIINKATEVFDWIGEKIMSGITWLVEFWREHGETIVTGVTETFTQIWTIVSGVFEILYEVVSSGLTWIGEFWQEHGETIKSAASTAWDLITGIIDGAMQVIEGIIEVVLGVIEGDWTRVWEGIQTIFEGVMTAVGAAWTAAKEIIGKVIKGTIEAVTDKFHEAIDKVKEAWENLKLIMRNPIKGTATLIQQSMDKRAAKKADGSHRTGAYNIPKNNYLANLHKGEMVLTSQASDQYRAMGGTENSPPVAVRGSQTTSNTSASFSPVVNINIEGDAKEEDVRDLERMMRNVFKREQDAFFSKLNLQS